MRHRHAGTRIPFPHPILPPWEWDTANRTTRPSVCSSSARPFMPPRGRPTLVVLSPVASSSLSRRSSLPRSLRTGYCDARLRRLPIPCSRGFSRLSAQLRPPPRRILAPRVYCSTCCVALRSSFPRDSSFVSNYYTARTQALVRAEAEPQARAGTATTQPLYGPPAGSVMTQPLYLPANPMMSYAAANSPALLLSDDPTVANVRTVCSASAALVVHMCPGENDCNPNQIEIGDTAR